MKYARWVLCVFQNKLSIPLVERLDNLFPLGILPNMLGPVPNLSIGSAELMVYVQFLMLESQYAFLFFGKTERGGNPRF